MRSVFFPAEGGGGREARVRWIRLLGLTPWTTTTAASSNGGVGGGNGSGGSSRALHPPISTPLPSGPAATSFSSLRLSPAAAASPPFSLCSTSLAHSPFPPSLFPCRTPQCGASRFFNEGSAQYLGCHNLPPTSQGGPPATANPPSHPTSASRLYGAHEPTSHHLARSLSSPSAATPFTLAHPLIPLPPVFNVSFDVSLRVNAEWARGWLRGMDPGGKCISSLLCFTSFLSFSVCVPPYSSTFISLSSATPLVWSSYIFFSLSLSPSRSLSLSPFIVSRFFSSSICTSSYSRRYPLVQAQHTYFHVRLYPAYPVLISFILDCIRKRHSRINLA